jgi:hypothetical protein
VRIHPTSAPVAVSRFRPDAPHRRPLCGPALGPPIALANRISDDDELLVAAALVLEMDAAARERSPATSACIYCGGDAGEYEECVALALSRRLRGTSRRTARGEGVMAA